MSSMAAVVLRIPVYARKDHTERIVDAQHVVLAAAELYADSAVGSSERAYAGLAVERAIKKLKHEKAGGV